MIKKIIGYLLSVLGLAGVAITVIPENLKGRLNIPQQIALLSETTLLIASGVLIIIGIALIWRSKHSKQSITEVPILQGNRIVGYRRH